MPSTLTVISALLSWIACAPSEAEVTDSPIQEAPQDKPDCVMRLQPESLDFGPHLIGAEPLVYVLLVSNSGDAYCSFREMPISPGGEFDVGALGSVVVPPGGEVTMQLSFAPSDVGPRQASLAVWIEELEAPVLMLLSGEGVLE